MLIAVLGNEINS